MILLSYLKLELVLSLTFHVSSISDSSAAGHTFKLAIFNILSSSNILCNIVENMTFLIPLKCFVEPFYWIVLSTAYR